MLSGFIKKLLFAREFMIAGGRIEVLGERETMFPVALLGRLQDENPEKTYSIAKDVLKEEIDRFTKKIGNSKAEMIVALKDIFEATGFGNLEYRCPLEHQPPLCILCPGCTLSIQVCC